MNAAIRRDRVADPVRRDEVAERVADALVPLFRQIEGVAAYYVIAAGDAEVISVAVVADREGAAAAARQMADWVARHVAPLVPGPAEVALGEVRGVTLRSI